MLVAQRLEISEAANGDELFSKEPRPRSARNRCAARADCEIESIYWKADLTMRCVDRHIGIRPTRLEMLQARQ